MKLLNFLLTTLLIITITSCSNNDSGLDPIPEVTLADFAGSWIATSAVFTNKANTSESVDFISVGGHVRFTAFEDGRMRTWVDFQDAPMDEWDAQAVIKDDKLIFTPAEASREPYTLTFELEENKIIFRNSDTDFDFSVSGAEAIPATSVYVFIPN